MTTLTEQAMRKGIGEKLRTCLPAGRPPTEYDAMKSPIHITLLLLLVSAGCTSPSGQGNPSSSDTTNAEDPRDVAMYCKTGYTDTVPTQLYFGGWNRYPSRRGGKGCFYPPMICDGLPDTVLVEVRGWIFSSISACHSDQAEYEFDMLLDFGWQPATEVLKAGVTCLNTAQAIVDHVSPSTVMLCGRSDGNDSLNSYITESGIAMGCEGRGHYGGGRSHIFHVEAMGFRPGDEKDACKPRPTAAVEPPTEWKYSIGSDGPHEHPMGASRWSFDLFHPDTHSGAHDDGELNQGDYVRIVGLILHEPNALSRRALLRPASGQPENDCISKDLRNYQESYYAFREAGSKEDSTSGVVTEIHPVDYIAILPEPEKTDSQLVFVTFWDKVDLHRDVPLRMKHDAHAHLQMTGMKACCIGTSSAWQDAISQVIIDDRHVSGDTLHLSIDWTDHRFDDLPGQPYYHGAFLVWYQ